MRYAVGDQLDFQLTDRPGAFSGKVLSVNDTGDVPIYLILVGELPTIETALTPLNILMASEEEILAIGDPHANSLPTPPESHTSVMIGLVEVPTDQPDTHEYTVKVEGLDAALERIATGLKEQYGIDL